MPRPSPINLASAAHDPDIMAGVAEAAVAAGAIVLAHRGKCAVQSKTDLSPVTIADREAEALVLEKLHALLPGVPIVSEEAMALGTSDAPARDFILVDALDGTKEYVTGSDEFSVNIALIHERTPVGGAIYAPAMRRLWTAGVEASTCEIDPGAPMASARNMRLIRTRPAPQTGWTAVTSLRHMSAETAQLLARLPIGSTLPSGSSIKFCHIAEGVADVYPRYSPTMEWDTAAGHALVLAAGGIVVDADGRRLRYAKRKTRLQNGPFVALGDPGVRRIVYPRKH